MKTAEEKLQYKTHFFKLGQGRIIELDHEDYWAYFWQEPETTNDIFELLTAYDLRTILSQNRSNYLLLVYKLTNKIIATAESDKSFNPSQLLNCVRLLTKLLPFFMELPDYNLMESQFWLNPLDYDPRNFVEDTIVEEPTAERNKDCSDILSVRLIRSIMTLLFYKGFTILISKSKSDTSSMKQLSVWEPGIGITSKYQVPDLIIESNRAALLQLLITLSGVSLYQLPSRIVTNGSLFLTLLVSTFPRMEILTLVCSLINVLCRSVRYLPLENMLQFNDPTLKFLRYSYVSYCIELLTLMVVYPLPSKNLQFLKDLNIITDDNKPYNMARLYLGKLHKDNEILFLSSSLINHLKSPLNSNGSQAYSQNGNDADGNFFNKFNYYTNTNASSPIWSTEIIMLLWELFQCNLKFRQVAGKRFYVELCFLLTYYIKQLYGSHREKNFVRLSSCFLLYLSHNELFHDQLLELLPDVLSHISASIHIDNQNQLSTRDFLVIQLCQILSNHASFKTTNSSINPLLTTTLVEILYNIIPLVSSSKRLPGTNDPTKKLNNINPRRGISYTSCTALTNLIVRFSDKKFLLKTSFNQDLLALLIRSICTAALRDPAASRMLLFSMLKGEKIYDQIWNSIHSLDNEYFNGDILVLKSIEDKDEDTDSSSTNKNGAGGTPNDNDDAASNNSTNNTNRNSKSNTPLNGSVTSLNIQSEDDNDSVHSKVYNSFAKPNHTRSSLDDGESVSSLPELRRSSIDEYEAETEAIDQALRPVPPTGMTPKAKGKQKKGTPIRKSWGGNDALRIILTIIIPYLKLTLNEIWSGENGSSVDAFELARHIGNSNFEQLIRDNLKQINFDFLPTSPLVQLKFSWSRVSLGWYISLLYGDIYNTVDNINALVGARNKILKNITSSVMSIGKFFNGEGGNNERSVISSLETPAIIEEIGKSISTINHWHQTNIKLFRIEVESTGFFDVLNSKLVNTQNQATPKTPSMERPNTLTRRLSDLRINQPRGGSVSSIPNSGLSTPKEESESYFPRVGSVSSLQSLNAINRSRSNTPRNSFSN